MEKFDIAVVGAGHAGVEAALASARCGAKTALFTLSLDSLANMPCNPSIGGTGKGHLVYEIDALGGEMAYEADLVTMQSRMLNSSKGAAVQSKRIQADRRLYSALMKRVVETTPNLFLIQAEVTEIITENGRVVGVFTEPLGEFAADAVVLSTGTYLGGTTHVGDVSRSSGPDNSLPASKLTSSLLSLGFDMLRFKTGTPPRINRRSIDFSVLEAQRGDDYIVPFSCRTDEKKLNEIEQVECGIVYTNEKTHAIIRENLHLSPLYSGKIKGVGPRYCPSIEDKVVRFADKERHQLFIEPMGRGTDETYLQGFSSSLPASVQVKMVRSLRGFEQAEIMRPAYAIEYDCIDPTELFATLETKKIRGLFGAGQFNGTSGYEEAAAQGLLAGINASLYVRKMPQITLPRHSSYLGTLIDDLVTKGTNEPYRIMTARSEYRLLIRQDNARERLEGYALYAGTIDHARYLDGVRRKWFVTSEIERLKHVNISPSSGINDLLEERGSTPIKSGVSAAELIRRPELDYGAIRAFDGGRKDVDRATENGVNVEIKYEGYIRSQLDEAARQEKAKAIKLPADADYSAIKGLRLEAAQKLDKVRPLDIGQASRISGVNPADISVLLIWLKSGRT